MILVGWLKFLKVLNSPTTLPSRIYSYFILLLRNSSLLLGIILLFGWLMMYWIFKIYSGLCVLKTTPYYLTLFLILMFGKEWIILDLEWREFLFRGFDLISNFLIFGWETRWIIQYFCVDVYLWFLKLFNIFLFSTSNSFYILRFILLKAICRIYFLVSFWNLLSFLFQWVFFQDV